ncbi:MAG: cobalt-precorrin 5A hydrolase [Synergistaceae bacterium]|nr:cobalt-precorrin 5A hydrolase [Synergistaceae bacterium]
MNTDIVAFTNKGIALALRLSEFLRGSVYAPERFARPGVNVLDGSLTDWAGQHFSGALIFVGACGIAVRAIAPHVRNKLVDPAVIVVDEAGKFVIPVLSGHVGGANGLARKIAGFLCAQAVITTATDVNNLPAVDEWAVKHNCAIKNPEAVRHISGALLDGRNVGVAVTCENIPVPFPVTLWLRPKVLVLGAGCNKNTDPAEFERDALDFLADAGVTVKSLRALASIDFKKNEPAMKIFAQKHDISFLTFGAAELQALRGRFTASEEVRRFTGTDNVCERSAVMAAGEGAVLLRSKCVYENVTFALARSNDYDN